MKRYHVVLVPGFAGFDALGQLEYYSGVTPLIAGRPGVTLHFFDNFPTASVAVRAGRLMRYLAKRTARGEIAGDDEVSLVGHSTGGLDIRRLIWEIGNRTRSITVDGGLGVAPDLLLQRLKSVVFLSVPHWGTNIADWVHAHPVWREAVVAELRAAVAGSQAPILDRIEQSAAGAAAALTGSGVFHAVRDTVAEADERCGKRCPERTANAHEAASQLELYLRHMASDFSAIDDLTSAVPDGPPTSPAHFDERDRKRELKLWEDCRIQTRSYLTLGRRVFRFEPDRPAPVWELAKPWTWPEIVKDSAWSEGTDLVYRACYRACAGGPLDWPPLAGRMNRHLGTQPELGLQLWDNDGIVNTISMQWPAGDNVLVPGDHMDIVGHYRPVEAEAGSGRACQAYDLLGSASGFGPDQFRHVWQEIFAFTSGVPAPLCE